MADRIDNKKEWQDLLGKVLFKTFFHSWEWEEFLEKNFKWLKFERYIWQEQALLSLARVKIAGKERLISHPFCEYGGPLPLVPKIDGQRFQEEVFAEFKNPFKISFHPGLLNYFTNLEKAESPRETYLVENLHQKTTEQLWNDIDRNRHRSIKSAQTQNFQIEKCQKTEDLNNLYALYVTNLKKHKTLAYPFSFFEFFFQSPQAEILLVKNGKNLVGGNIFLFYNKFVHSFLCGFDENAKKQGAHSFVIWEEIKRGKEAGFELFDLGATRKSSSLKDFKERWGGRPLPIIELKNYAGESKFQNSFLRNIWGCLPAFLVKKLSSSLLKHKL